MTLETADSQANVFINCPFDKNYKPLLQALLFTVVDCGLEPRIGSERSDSGEVRVEKIKGLIRESLYSVHDISRMEPLGRGDLPRFNMPFELGLDLGCRAFGLGDMRRKKCLILEKKRFRYRKVLSNIAGNDIQAHKDDPQTLVRHVRNWILENTGCKVLSPTRIWQRYNEFYSHLEDSHKQLGYSKKGIAEMPIPEFVSLIKVWRTSNPPS